MGRNSRFPAGGSGISSSSSSPADSVEDLSLVKRYFNKFYSHNPREGDAKVHDLNASGYVPGVAAKTRAGYRPSKATIARIIKAHPEYYRQVTQPRPTPGNQVTYNNGSRAHAQVHSQQSMPQMQRPGMSRSASYALRGDYAPNGSWSLPQLYSVRQYLPTPTNYGDNNSYNDYDYDDYNHARRPAMRARGSSMRRSGATQKHGGRPLARRQSYRG